MILAQDTDYLSIFIWAIALVMLVLVGFGMVVWARRRMHETETAAPSAGFTLSDLRAMHQSGKISDAEYERAKAKIIATARAPAAKSRGQELDKHDG